MDKLLYMFVIVTDAEKSVLQSKDLFTPLTYKSVDCLEDLSACSRTYVGYPVCANVAVTNPPPQPIPC